MDHSEYNTALSCLATRSSSLSLRTSLPYISQRPLGQSDCLSESMDCQDDTGGNSRSGGRHEADDSQGTTGDDSQGEDRLGPNAHTSIPTASRQVVFNPAWPVRPFGNPFKELLATVDDYLYDRGFVSPEDRPCQWFAEYVEAGVEEVLDAFRSDTSPEHWTEDQEHDHQVRQEDSPGPPDHSHPPINEGSARRPEGLTSTPSSSHKCKTEGCESRETKPIRHYETRGEAVSGGGIRLQHSTWAEWFCEDDMPKRVRLPPFIVALSGSDTSCRSIWRVSAILTSVMSG